MGGEKRDRSLLLSGLMGSGKTSVGRLLSARLGRVFIDTDERIESASGLRVAELFEREGEAAFRSRESDVLRALPERDAVVALGGGVVIDPANRAVLRTKGVVIWLDASPETLARRLGAAADRPLLSGLDTKERVARLRALYAERRDAYAEADLRVETDAFTPEAVRDLVLDALGWGEAA